MVSWLMDDVLFKMGLRVVAVSWQLWISLMVEGMSFVGLGWHVWVSLVVVGLLFEMELMVVSLMVSVGLFRLDRQLVAVG